MFLRRVPNCTFRYWYGGEENVAEEYCCALLETATAFVLRAVRFTFPKCWELEFHLDCPLYAVQ
jgi:hypothetical protein